jgi:protein SCO1
MSKKAWIYIGFFTILVMAFLFGLSRVVPGFGKVNIPPISYVRPFSFTTQEGKKFGNADVAGKVNVVEFFFTTCTGACPRMNKKIKGIYEQYKSDPDFMVLSYTCDPETDSVPRLRRYADSIGAKSSNWIFLTGTRDSLYTACRISYVLDDTKVISPATNPQFIHTQLFALVDRQGNVRGSYDSDNEEEMKKLEKDIKEYLSQGNKSRFVNSLYGNNPN